MKKLINSIIIIFSILVSNGISYGNEIFFQSQESFSGNSFVEHCLKNGVNLIDAETGLSLLHIAVFEGRAEDVLRQIESGANIELESNGGEKPIHTAIFNGHIEIVDLLIKKRANINALFKTSKFQLTPLQIAVDQKQFPIAQLLINTGANVNAQGKMDKKKVTALSLAIKNNDQEMIDLLKSSGEQAYAAEIPFVMDPEIQGSSLHWAVKEGRIDDVLLLLENGANIELINQESTPLYVAIYYEHLELVNILIKKGANVNALMTNSEGSISSPLFTAVVGGNHDIVKALIAAGADINFISTIKGEHKRSIIIEAMSGNHYSPDIIETLLSEGVDPTGINGDNAPLTTAIFQRKFEIATLLLSKNINLNYPEPLLTAIQMNQVEIVRTLVSKGVNVNSPIPDYTILQIAKFHNNAAIIDILVSAGAN